MVLDCYQCKYCLREFKQKKQLTNHTIDCFRKHSTNPPERKCSMCDADYTRKSGSAYRTHMRKCETTTTEKPKTKSAVKQSERRKQVIPEIICTYCDETFINVTVGRFGDHKYKCKNSIPNYDKDYQAQYRKQMKKFRQLVMEYYSDIDECNIKSICQQLRKESKNHTNLNETELVKKLYTKIT